MQKFIAYCRTSTENQKDKETIQLQIENLDEYAIKQGIDLVRYFKDDGVSGGLGDRPGLAEMFSYLENNSDIEGVLIYKLDRLARDLYIQEHLIKKLELLHRSILSTKEPDLDGKDPMRKAFRQFMGIVSELEKAFITMRLTNSRNSAVAKGKWHGGLIYGYRSDKNGVLVIDPHESEIVKRIFCMKKKQRKGLSDIAKILNSETIRSKHGGKWYPSTIRAILLNDIYRGKLTFKGKSYPGNHQALF